MNPTEIIANAKLYNAEYPEAVAEIEAGTPELYVAATLADSLSRVLRFSATWGIRCEDGGFIASGSPETKTINRRDGRLSRTDYGTELYAKMAAEAGVALVIRERGI